MKFFVVALFLVTLLVAFTIASFSGEIQTQIVEGFMYLMKLSAENASAPPPAPTAQGPAAPAEPASSSGFKPPGFVGPSGPPHIIGPTGNPPNY